MLERMIVAGFQCHVKAVVEFDKHVTSICGATESGKSALLRALRWVALNEPSGDSIINWDSDEARVRLHVDGHAVTRRRGAHGNLYVLDGEQLKAFGTGVPEPITNLLRLSDTNFQRQLDPHFWITQVPGQIAKEMNRIVNLDIIDSTIANVNTMLRRVKTEAEIIEQRQEAAKARVKSLDWVPALDKALQRAEVLGTRLEAMRLAQRRLSVELEKAEECAQTRSNAADAMPAMKNVVRLGEQVLQAGNKARKLRQLLEGLAVAEKDAKKIPPSMGSVDALVVQLATLRARKTRLGGLIFDLDNGERQSCAASQAAKTSEEALHKKLQGRCPICSTEIKAPIKS